MCVAPAAWKQLIDLNEEKRKRITNFNRVKALDAQVNELEQSMANTKEIKRHLTKANEANEANARL